MNILHDPFGLPLRVSANPLLFIASAYSTGGIEDETPYYFEDSELSDITGALVNYTLDFPTDLEQPTLVNLTPTICDIEGANIVQLDTGLAQLNAIKNNVTTSIFLNFTRDVDGGPGSRKFISFIPETISAALADALTPFMSDSTPDVDYYSTFNHATGTYVRNTNCWMTLDLGAVVTASSYWGGWTPARGGTAVTRRHVLITRHYPIEVGLLLRFVDSDDVLHTRTVIGTYAEERYSTTENMDWRIIVLDSNLPLSITPMKIAGEWIARPVDHMNSPQNGNYYMGGLGFWLNQNRKVYANLLGTGEWSSTHVRTFEINGHDYVSSPTMATYVSLWPGVSERFLGDSVYFSGKMDYLHQVISGDSGHPICVVVNGEPVLISTFTGYFIGARAWTTGLLNDFIAMADADAIARGNLATPTGYTVTVAADPTL